MIMYRIALGIAGGTATGGLGAAAIPTPIICLIAAGILKASGNNVADRPLLITAACVVATGAVIGAVAGGVFGTSWHISHRLSQGGLPEALSAAGDRDQLAQLLALLLYFRQQS